jgi:cephalosporin-C deacetylase-like acetyl esterase
MPDYSTFDKFFLNLPPFDRENDFDQFWKKSVADLKKIPMEPVFEKKGWRSHHGFALYKVSYKSFLKYQISGSLLVPDKTDKPPVIIHLHDYNKKSNPEAENLNQKSAHFFLTLRGHENLNTKETQDISSPGFMIENIFDRDTYYVKAVYLDAYRAIDALRLMPEIDCGRIGIYGKGLGAAAAIFTAANSERVAALVLDTPFFCYLPVLQNLSTSEASREINEFIELHKVKKKQIKSNLTYFDCINFADRITVPVLALTGFKDTVTPPECVFALFNHFQSEKRMEIFPDDGNSTGGEKQFVKSINWLAENLS